MNTTLVTRTNRPLWYAGSIWPGSLWVRKLKWFDFDQIKNGMCGLERQWRLKPCKRTAAQQNTNRSIEKWKQPMSKTKFTNNWWGKDERLEGKREENRTIFLCEAHWQFLAVGEEALMLHFIKIYSILTVKESFSPWIPQEKCSSTCKETNQSTKPKTFPVWSLRDVLTQSEQ